MARCARDPDLRIRYSFRLFGPHLQIPAVSGCFLRGEPMIGRQVSHDVARLLRADRQSIESHHSLDRFFPPFGCGPNPGNARQIAFFVGLVTTGAFFSGHLVRDGNSRLGFGRDCVAFVSALRLSPRACRDCQRYQHCCRCRPLHTGKMSRTPILQNEKLSNSVVERPQRGGIGSRASGMRRRKPDD